GMLTPVVLGVIGREQRRMNLDVDGVVQMLQSQKASIVGALPSSVASALAPTGVLEGFGDTADAAAGRARASGTRTLHAASRGAPAASRRRRNWVALAAVVAGAAALLWALTRGPGLDSERADRSSPAQARTDADRRAVPADEVSFVVSGVDVGRELEAITDDLSATMGRVSDGPSAEASLPELSALADRLDELEPLVERLPDDAKAAFGEIARDSASAMEPEADRISALPAVPDVVGQTRAREQRMLADLAA